MAEESLDRRGDLGIGNDVPKELREPRRSFMKGLTLRLCMYAAASLIELLVAGTSIVEPNACGSAGMLIETLRSLSAAAPDKSVSRMFDMIVDVKKLGDG